MERDTVCPTKKFELNDPRGIEVNEFAFTEKEKGAESSPRHISTPYIVSSVLRLGFQIYSLENTNHHVTWLDIDAIQESDGHSSSL